MSDKAGKLSWGLGVWLLYGGFVLFTLVIVGFASLQSFDLVESNYYEKGIAYQEQIDKVERTRALPEQPRITVNESAKSVTLLFPESYAADQVSGTLSLYRPSNSAYDRHAEIHLAVDRTFSLAMSDLPPGLWKVKLDWQYAGRNYFNEEVIVIE